MTTKINNITNLDNILSTKSFIDSNKEIDLSDQLSFDVIKSNMKDFLSKKLLSNLYNHDKSSNMSNNETRMRTILGYTICIISLLFYWNYGFSNIFNKDFFLNMDVFYMLIPPFIAIFALIKNPFSKNKKSNKLPDKYYNLDIDYILPLSADELKIFINNDPVLKKYIEENNNTIYSQYMIDKICNKNNSYRKMFDKVNLSINSALDYYSEYNNFKIKDIIFEEQKKVKDIVLDNNLNKYKVYYSIENGPTKNITFKYHTDDRNVFEKYIISMTNKEYERKFSIINIEEIN